MGLQHDRPVGPPAALYYPYMRPPRRWLARALLYFEVAGSIVQPEDEAEVFVGLQTLGAFRPCAVRSALEDIPDPSELVSEVVDRMHLYPIPAAGDPDLLLPRKVPGAVAEELVKAGLFEVHPEGLLATTPSAMPNLLAVVADRVSPELSVQHGLAWRPATDRQTAFDSLRIADHTESAIVVALPGLPQPRFSSDDDLSRVVEFQQGHRAELAAYRERLDVIVEQIAANAVSATDVVDALVDEVSEHARQIEAMQDLPSVKEMASDLVVSVGLGAGAGAITGGPPGAAIGGGAGGLRSLWANRTKVRAAVVGRRQRRDHAHLNYLLEAQKAGVLR